MKNQKRIQIQHEVLASFLPVSFQEVEADSRSALQAVLESDMEREVLLKEEEMLTAKLEAGDEEAGNRLTEVFEKMDLIEADSAHARASIILTGLGFTLAMQEQQTKEFSGGWRMRIALAQALFCRPDLLMLDEPTNMLDMQAVIWLENHLKNWPKALLLVSHDRTFLDQVGLAFVLVTFYLKLDTCPGGDGHLASSQQESSHIPRQLHRIPGGSLRLGDR